MDVWLGSLKRSPERGFEGMVRDYRVFKSVDISRRGQAFLDRVSRSKWKARVLGEETYRSALPPYDTCSSSWLSGHSSCLAANNGAMIYVARC
jgi:hypothetical protein